jgi:antitoxin component of RelBE/YafQ-DinJ toxin-antitoxin module
MGQTKQKQIAVRLDNKTLQKLHELQKKTGLTQSELFRQFILKGKVTCSKKYFPFVHYSGAVVLFH